MKNYILMPFIVMGLIFISPSITLSDTLVLTPVKEDPKVDAKTKEKIPVVEEKATVPPTVPPVVEPLKEEAKATPEPEPKALVRDAITGKKVERKSPFEGTKQKESLRDSVRGKFKE